MLVQRHQRGFLGNEGRNRRRLLGHPRQSVAGPALGNLADLEAAKSELAAEIVEPFPIPLGELTFRPLLQPADRNHDQAHALRYPLAAPGPAASVRLRSQIVPPDAAGLDAAERPQTAFTVVGPWIHNRLEIVELADLGSEDMHDHIAGIDQHPVAIGHAFDMDVLDSVVLQAFQDIFRNRADVPVGPARGDDHEVGKRGFAAKVDGDRLFRLHILEAGEDQVQRLVGVRLRLQGRILGRCFTRGLLGLG